MHFKLTKQPAPSEDEFEEWLAEDYRDDPVAHETKWGEGWTLTDFYNRYLTEGN